MKNIKKISEKIDVAKAFRKARGDKDYYKSVDEYGSLKKNRRDILMETILKEAFPEARLSSLEKFHISKDMNTETVTVIAELLEANPDGERYDFSVLDQNDLEVAGGQFVFGEPFAPYLK